MELTAALSADGRLASVEADCEVGALYRIGDEVVRVKGQNRPVGSSSRIWSIDRGREATTPADHDSGTDVLPLVDVVGSDALSAPGGAGGDTLSDPVTLSAADLLDLDSTPIEIVPSPGAGKAIWPLSWILAYHFGSAVFPFVNLELLWDGGSSFSLRTQLDQADDKFEADSPSEAAESLAVVDNAALILQADGPMTIGPVATTTLADGGSGYAPGDTGYIIDPVSSQQDATYEIDTVDGGGAVLTYHMTAQGSGYAVANAVGTFATSGAGTGFTVNVTAVTLGDGTLDVTVLYRVVDLA